MSSRGDTGAAASAAQNFAVRLIPTESTRLVLVSEYFFSTFQYLSLPLSLKVVPSYKADPTWKKRKYPGTAGYIYSVPPILPRITSSRSVELGLLLH
jgi:hypothetical protein